MIKNTICSFVFRSLFSAHCVLVTVLGSLCLDCCVWVTAFWLLFWSLAFWFPKSPRASWSYFLVKHVLQNFLRSIWQNASFCEQTVKENRWSLATAVLPLQYIFINTSTAASWDAQQTIWGADVLCLWVLKTSKRRSQKAFFYCEWQESKISRLSPCMSVSLFHANFCLNVSLQFSVCLTFHISWLHDTSFIVPKMGCHINFLCCRNDEVYCVFYAICFGGCISSKIWRPTDPCWDSSWDHKELLWFCLLETPKFCRFGWFSILCDHFQTIFSYFGCFECWI